MDDCFVSSGRCRFADPVTPEACGFGVIGTWWRGVFWWCIGGEGGRDVVGVRGPVERGGFAGERSGSGPRVNPLAVARFRLWFAYDKGL
jgi:hypothetical protein